MPKLGLTEKVRMLGDAATLSQGRVDDDLVSDISTMCTKADRRLTFSGDATVVALAGATGSGKSTTFNAIANSMLAATGVRRPTTSRALAAWWDGGESGADTEALLNWLDIRERHRVVGGDKALTGLVLLDLPDHDSVEVTHRMEVDRLVALVDAFIWVLDPQKYADNVLHEFYLQPLASHADVMLVVLNQVDKVTPEQLGQMRADLRSLLDKEGLAKAEIMGISAKTGQGVPELRARLGQIVKGKKASAMRLHHDVDAAARKLAELTGSDPVPQLDKRGTEQLITELSHAAGAPAVADAVKSSWRKRGSEATGWPAVTWLSALRPDPLRRLHLDRLPSIASKELEPVREQRSSIQPMGGVAESRVTNAIRQVATKASTGMPRGWADRVREASTKHEKWLRDDLDLAIGRTDLGMRSGNGWWLPVRIMQWLVMAAMLVGVVWLIATMFFQLPLPRYRDVPIPTWLALGGAAVGILVAVLSRIGVEVGAQMKAKTAEASLRREISKAARRSVVEPVSEEVTRYAHVRELLGTLTK